jgi:uncharacterized protein YigE (DUF2233 family)
MQITPRIQRRRMLASLAIVPLCLTGCGESEQLQTPTNPPVPTLVPTNLAAAPTSAPMIWDQPEPADTGWVAGDHGIELRRMRAQVRSDQYAPIIITRLDPSQIRMRVAYRPEQPLALRAWFAAERPLVALNGGYFNEDYRSSALVVSDGVAHGDSYVGFGGMLAASDAAGITLHALRESPYETIVPVEQATQSAPMLVFPGGVAADVQHNGARARRSVAAIDRSGRLLLMVAPTSLLTLGDLERWLLESDLAIDRALNLDGGSSSGLFLASGTAEVAIDSFSPLPIVVLIHRQTY